jgi:hypothetical protein
MADIKLVERPALKTVGSNGDEWSDDQITYHAIQDIRRKIERLSRLLGPTHAYAIEIMQEALWHCVNAAESTAVGSGYRGRNTVEITESGCVQVIRKPLATEVEA